MIDTSLRDKLKAAIASSVQTNSRPKDVLKVLRSEYPKAKSKDLALAAFALMIEVADQDDELAAALQDFGLNARGTYDLADAD